MKTLFLLLALFSAPLVCTASAYDAVLTDDTSLALTGKATKAGKLPMLVLDAKHRALFKFDLSTLPTGRTASNVTSATLTVFLSRVTKPGAISLSRIAGSWDEEMIPVVTFTGLGNQTAVIGATAKNNYVRLDVTDLVKGWMDGSIVNAGLAIGADASGLGVVIALDSKENTATGHPAKLDVEFIDQPALSQANKGAWSGTTSYKNGEIVSLNGSTWIATAANTNSPPAANNTNWSPLAQKGDAGPAGSDVPGGLLASFSSTTPTGYSDTGLAIANWTEVPGSHSFSLNVRNQLAPLPLTVDGKAYWLRPDTGKFVAYNPTTNTYAAIADHAGDFYQTYVASNGKIYAIGGFADTGNLIQRVDEYDPSTDIWTQRADAPYNIYSSSSYRVAAAVNGRIYGWSNQSSHIEVFDIVANSWSNANSVPKGQGTFLSATNGKIYFFSGDGVGVTVIQEYDPVADIWTAKTGTAGASFYPLTATSASNGKFYGGSLGAILSTYDPLSDSVRNEATNPTYDTTGSLRVLFEVNGILYNFADGDGWKAPLTSFGHIYFKQ